MKFDVEQRIFNIYRHHDEDLLQVICSPSFKIQIETAKEYIKDVLHILISNYRYNEEENFCLPEVNLDWLNIATQSFKKSGLHGKLLISNSDDEIIIDKIGQVDNDITDFYNFLSEIYQNNIKRDVFYNWKNNVIQHNEMLTLKDQSINGLFDIYKTGILSINSIKDAYKSLTFLEESIISSSVQIFSDYKIFSLAFLTEENIIAMPHIMENFLPDFLAFNLEHLIIEQRAISRIALKPIYFETSVNDFEFLNNINSKRFKDKMSMAYDSAQKKYLFEINLSRE
jgi:hypothetical protein